MSVIKFELKKEHIALIENIDLDILFKNGGEDNIFGYSDDIFEDVGVILYGAPEGDFDPLSSDTIEYSDEQKEEMSMLISQLIPAMKIILQNQNVEVGNYKTKHHLIDWKKIK